MAPNATLGSLNRGREPKFFATTRWSLVLAAGEQRSSDEARDALATLCELYWYPLYAFLRGRGHSPADAEDLTQAFFTALLEKDVLSRADPSKGRFRSFLLKCLQNFSANVHAKNTARKRGGDVRTLSLDFAAAEDRLSREPATAETPERSFDRRWALTLLDGAMSQLRAEAHEAAKGEHFDALTPYLTGDDSARSYAETATMLGSSEGAVKVAVHRLRRRFRDIVRQEILQTVSTPADIDDELRHLLSSVQK
jgi:RNA polymerase sigma factor (sigma-70 family)